MPLINGCGVGLRVVLMLCSLDLCDLCAVFEFNQHTPHPSLASSCRMTSAIASKESSVSYASLPSAFNMWVHDRTSGGRCAKVSVAFLVDMLIFRAFDFLFAPVSALFIYMALQSSAEVMHQDSRAFLGTLGIFILQPPIEAEMTSCYRSSGFLLPLDMNGSEFQGVMRLGRGLVEVTFCVGSTFTGRGVHVLMSDALDSAGLCLARAPGVCVPCNSTRLRILCLVQTMSPWQDDQWTGSNFGKLLVSLAGPNPEVNGMMNSLRSATQATTIITPLPEITPFISLQLRVARLEQEMSEVKKTDHSTDVLASIKSQKEFDTKEGSLQTMNKIKTAKTEILPTTSSFLLLWKLVIADEDAMDKEVAVRLKTTRESRIVMRRSAMMMDEGPSAG
ncbi:hypothetical protein Tco_0425953 [Tanacetum coccineum]